MPEGPEASYLANFILKNCQGRILKRIRYLSGRYKTHGPPKNYSAFAKALPLKCINVTKKGKVIFIHFEKGWYIISKLGLTGWWYTEDEIIDWTALNRKNVVLSFHKDLIYSDFRNFGTLTITNDINEIEAELNRLAPDITDPSLTFTDIKHRLEKLDLSNKNILIEDGIINQRMVFSGIGNYLKSEILYKVGISPLRPVAKITIDEWKTIFHTAQTIAKKMIKLLEENNIEKYMKAMKIYQKKTDPHGNVIERHKSKDERTTFWVPKLQK